MKVACLFGIERRHNIWVRQPGCSLNLAPKPLNRLRMPDQLRIDQLERHRPVHQLVLGPVDDTHSAAANPLDDAVSRMIPQFRRQRDQRVFARFGERSHQTCNCVVCKVQECVVALDTVIQVLLNLGSLIGAELAKAKVDELLLVRMFLLMNRSHRFSQMSWLTTRSAQLPENPLKNR